VARVERILVPLDHSPGSDAIVESACAVARGLGAELTLMHVYEPPNEVVGMVSGATVGGELAAEHAAGAALLDRAAAILRTHQIGSSGRILERAASPSEAIAHHAQADKFDLIVMGTHARGGVARWALGSVADQVLHASPCPLLLVHLPAA